MRSKRILSSLGLVVAAFLTLAGGVFAQVSGGNIYGSIADESGAPMPGATVTLTGPGGSRSTLSGSGGDFRFLNLSPATYKVDVALAGFGGVTRDVIVNTGTNVSLPFGLKVAKVQETVTVTAETPVIDVKKVGTATTLTREELSEIPNSRDPWAIIRTIPGIQVDRMNIAGNESGQQANFTSKGSSFRDTMWNLDGVVVTDTTATGSSPTYFDYDAFDEVAVTTGGNDLRIQTGGLGLNFVTKRGTNAFHGDVHTYFTHDDLQSSNLPADLVGDPRLKGSDKASHIQQIGDYGADFGGPIVKDKLWFYGSYGKQDIRNVRLNQTSDKTVLESYNAKVNFQASKNDSFELFYFNGAKIKKGRSVFGVTGVEDDSFLVDQGNNYKRSFPHGLMKLEYNRVFSPSFFVNTKVASYDTGFVFEPRGGRDQEGTFDFFHNVSRGSSIYAQNTRPSYNANVDANYFRPGLGGNHELKFGFGYRKTPVESSSGWNGSKIYAVQTRATGGIAEVTRDKNAASQAQYSNVYLGDSFSKDRLTLNLGLRFDHQSGGNVASNVPASPAFPELLPAIDFPGTGQGITWNDLSPRAGFTYALGESRKTLVRGSYARYAGQLASGDASFDNPLTAYSYLTYRWVDRNGDGFAQKDEVLTDVLLGAGYVDPANPGSAVSSNKIDPNIKNSHDSEVIVGLERELFPNLSVSAAYTYRKSTDLDWAPRIGLTSVDYTVSDTQTFGGYTGVAYAPDPAKVAASGNGRILTNRLDYYRQYGGFELVLNKRMSKKWMARAAFSYGDQKEHLGPGAVQNPTRTTQGAQGGPFERFYSGPQVDGGEYAPASGGSGKGNIFIASKWQVVANALYQLPAGFQVGAALFGRQGNPFPIVINNMDLGADGNPIRVVATPTIDGERYNDVWNLDLRLSKDFKMGGAKMTLTADGFNVFNSNVVLDRTRDADSATFRRINEILNPRIIRFGVRFNF